MAPGALPAEESSVPDDLLRLLHYYRLRTTLAADPTPRVAVVSGPLTTISPHTLAVLAGSFNPLTRAHVALLAAARAQGVAPTAYALSTHIVDKELASGLMPEDRLLLLADQAAQDGSSVLLINRGLYVDQARALRQHFPALTDLWFVVGFDKIVQIFDPRYYPDLRAALRDLFQQAGFLVAPRDGADHAALQAFLAHPDRQPYAGRVRPLDLPPDLRTLSASQVRQAIAQGQPWQHLVPPHVAAFLVRTGAFHPPVLVAGEPVDRYGLRRALFTALVRLIEAGLLEPTSLPPLDRLVESALAPGPEGRALRTLLTTEPVDLDRLRLWLAGLTPGRART